MSIKIPDHQRALIFQGGGALGAYEVGYYQAVYEKFFKEANDRLDEIKEKEYERLDENSKSEYNGLKKMFDMLSAINLRELKK